MTRVIDHVLATLGPRAAHSFSLNCYFVAPPLNSITRNESRPVSPLSSAGCGKELGWKIKV